MCPQFKENRLKYFILPINLLIIILFFVFGINELPVCP